ncbi:MAG: ECF transporter S component, partial [Promethearchaeota archaeon]
FSSIMTALVTVSTMFIQIPTPATNGYFNIGEAIIFITAIIFGPYIGGFAGGVGSALADLIGGWYPYVPITFIVKGLEGLIIGYISQKMRNNPNFIIDFFKKSLAILAGAPIMVIGYMLSEYYILNYGAEAFVEVPVNILQAVVGLIIAIPVVKILQKSGALDQFYRLQLPLIKNSSITEKPEKRTVIKYRQLENKKDTASYIAELDHQFAQWENNEEKKVDKI